MQNFCRVQLKAQILFRFFSHFRTLDNKFFPYPKYRNDTDSSEKYLSSSPDIIHETGFSNVKTISD